MAKKKSKDIVKVEANTVVVSSEHNPDIVPYLFSLDRIEKANCLLCQSEHREEAEEMYDAQVVRKNYTAIKNKLKDKHDFDICLNAVRNHMVRHHKRATNNAALQEYSEDVQQWVNMQTNKVASLKSRKAIMEREMFNIAQLSDDVDLVERRKNAEVIKKLAETILVYDNKLAEYQEEVKPINLLFQQLTVIVNDEMQYVDNSSSKKLVGKILSRLKESCGSMLTGAEE